MTKKKPKAPSTIYNKKTADLICEKLMEGVSLREICRGEGVPKRGTIYSWLIAHEAFADQYARACEVREDGMFDELFDIADDSSNDWMKRKDGEEALDSEHVQRSKLRIDTRKWALARMRPKKYGDRLDLNHGGQDGNPVTTKLVVEFIDPKPK